QDEQRQPDRRDDDVQHLERRAEAFDVAVEIAADGAQLLPDARALVEEALDLRLLLRAHEQRSAILARGLQLAETLLGLIELGLQTFFGRAQLQVGLALQRLDGRERARVARAAAQADE